MYNPPTRAVLIMEKTKAIAQIKGFNLAPPAAASSHSQESFFASETPQPAVPNCQSAATGVPARQTIVRKGSYGEFIIIVIIVFALGATGVYLLELHAANRKKQRNHRL